MHSEQTQALARFRELAKPHKLQVQADAEGFPVIPGRYGQIEWYCDGQDCAARFGGFCALPRQFALAVYTNRPRLFQKLWAIPGVKRHQMGDHEMRAVFPPEALEQVAGVIRTRRKRHLVARGSPKTGCEDGVQRRLQGARRPLPACGKVRTHQDARFSPPERASKCRKRQRQPRRASSAAIANGEGGR